MNPTIYFWRRKYILFPLILCALIISLLGQDEISDEELEALLSDEDALEAWLEAELTGWDFSAFTRVGAGHSDNVLLATVNPQSGDYLRSELEVFLTHFPDNNGEFFSYLNGTDIRYFGVEDADKEQLWLSDTEWTRYINDRINAKFIAQYIFFDQILDLSISERDVSRQRIEYNGYGLGNKWEYDAKNTNVLSLGFMGYKEDYKEVLGQDWKGVLDLGWRRAIWKTSKIEVELTKDIRDHDDRVQRDQFGRAVPGTLLKTDRTFGSVELTQEWGKDRNMDVGLELRYLENRDNGIGYNDFDQWSFDASLDGEWGGFEASLNLGINQTDFIIQKARRFGTEVRKREDFFGEFFLKKKLMKRFSVYLLAEYEESHSNVVEDEYDALSGSLGIQLDIWGQP
jgi:hypothetical protein